MEKRCYGCMEEKVQSPICEHCGYNEHIDNLSHQLPVGTVLREQYRIGRALGQGGFGITYIAWDLALEQKVAIKEYFPSAAVSRDCSASHRILTYGGDSEKSFQYNRERFLREGRMLAKLGNVPGIVKVHSMFQENGTAYIVMEYVQGMDLRRYVQMAGGRLSVRQTLTILKPVMEALKAVHAAELVHRDLSPDNIMLQSDGSAKLLDFGAAREVVDADAEKALSRSTEAVLKHGFAPIEQYQKRGALGPWTDVYALCATIYYCLMGKLPMDAPERVAEDMDAGWDQVPGLTQAQRQALEHGMALRAKNRLASVDVLMAALYPAQPSPEPKPAPSPQPAPRPVPQPKPAQKKRPFPWMALAAVLVVLLTVGVFRSLGNQQQERPQPWENNVLMKADEQSSVFGQAMSREEITVITFLDTTSDKGQNAWDASVKRDGSVWAWTEEKNDTITLYIAGEGGVAAPEKASRLFQDYSNVTRINFNDAFHTDNTVSMREMFLDCRSLTELDLSGLHTTNVTDMSYLFFGCHKLENLNVSGWDTRKVTTMQNMFSKCPTLEELDLSSWDTSAVTDMKAMFSLSGNVSGLDLGDWEVDQVRQYALFGDSEMTYRGRPWKELFTQPDSWN